MKEVQIVQATQHQRTIVIRFIITCHNAGSAENGEGADTDKQAREEAGDFQQTDSLFILEKDNYCKSAKYALENSNFKDNSGLHIIQANLHQDNVRVRNERCRLVNVSKSPGAACLSSLTFTSAQEQNLFTGNHSIL